MKKVLMALSLVAVVTAFSCKEKASNKINESNVELAAERDTQAKNLPVMTFEKREHDFGTIVNGTPQETVFKFTNTGNAPLIITDAKSSCGCTIPEYPKNTPISPGETGELLVKFNGSGQNQGEYSRLEKEQSDVSGGARQHMQSPSCLPATWLTADQIPFP